MGDFAKAQGSILGYTPSSTGSAVGGRQPCVKGVFK